MKGIRHLCGIFWAALQIADFHQWQAAASCAVCFWGNFRYPPQKMTKPMDKSMSLVHLIKGVGAKFYRGKGYAAENYNEGTYLTPGFGELP